MRPIATQVAWSVCLCVSLRCHVMFRSSSPRPVGGSTALRSRSSRSRSRSRSPRDRRANNEVGVGREMSSSEPLLSRPWFGGPPNMAAAVPRNSGLDRALSRRHDASSAAATRFFDTGARSSSTLHRTLCVGTERSTTSSQADELASTTRRQILPPSPAVATSRCG